MESLRICPECSEEIRPARRLGPHLAGHARSKQAKYRYLNGDSKHPYELKVCPGCGEESLIQVRHTFCSYECRQTGTSNSNWKGDQVKYVGAHGRVYRARGSAKDHSCEECGAPAKEWAQTHDTVGDDPSDYRPLCKPCHGRYDVPPWTHCKRGHPLTDDNVYRSGKNGKTCRQCALDRARLRREGKRLSASVQSF